MKKPTLGSVRKLNQRHLKATKEKMYTVRYHVMARTLMDARKKAKASEPDEICINQEWQDSGNKHLADAIGFQDVPTAEEEWEEEDTRK